MKVEYGANTIGDDAVGDFIEPFERSHTRDVQDDKMFRADYTSTIGRNNRNNRFGITVEKEHASKAAAMLYTVDYADSLAVQDDLVITEGATIKTMANAVLVGVDLVEIKGVSTKFKFTFTGGAFV